MSKLFRLTEAQMARLQPCFPKSHRRPRVDDRCVPGGVIFIDRDGLRWCGARREHGPAKTLCNRWVRGAEKGVFARIMEGLAAGSAGAAERKTIMIDATCPKARRTASSLRAKRGTRRSARTSDRANGGWADSSFHGS